MSEASLTVEAVGAELREAARSTVGEPGGVQEPENSIDGQLSDSKSNPGGATDQLQSPLSQHLRTMASPEAMADLKTLREIINADIPKVNVQDSITKVAPLHIAAKRGLVSAIGVLLKAGARLAVQDREGATPFFTATEAEQADVMEELLKPRLGDDDVKSPLEIRDNSGRTPLLLASINGFLKGAKLLIDAGANRNAQTFESKSTPLIAACSWGYQDVVEALLDHDSSNPSRRADLNLQNADGATALHVAIIEGRHKIAELLLNVGVDVTIKDNNGQSTLHLASRQDHQSVVNGLLGMKANVDNYDGDGRTPLHIAIDSLQKVQSKLSLGLFRWAGLKEEDLSEARPQTAQYIAIIITTSPRPWSSTRSPNRRE
ncbi:hypothetical protein CCUS01_13270 [Colletotrichum cuscutae]|uniref:Ankyrin repeat protein n=1 Tax=Colletotrichum cuscutae TaxID=1209917 RepID=A0AAI9YC68_9PEZI|nr:hypothetical protein CCUS01_13270 [Colletotrichum cuscutae]